jgi:hypothetical protein
MNEPMSDESPFRAFLSVFGGRARAEERARLEAAAQAVPDGDYFSLLGLPRDCSSVGATAAVDALLSLLDARAGDRADAASLHPDLRQVLLDARDVLGDDSRREAYRAAITAAELVEELPRGGGSGDLADPPTRR